MNTVRSTKAVGLSAVGPRSWGRLAGVIAGALLAFGCASPNVNPGSPKPGMGYVDFYVSAQSGLAWEVQRWNSTRNRYEPLFSQFEPVAEPVLRLELTPGPHQLSVTFLNRVTAEPATLELAVREGTVIPVRISLVAAGTTSVRDRQTSIGGTAFGRYGRRTKIVSDEETFYRISASPEDAQPYQPKQRMPYAQPPAN